MLDLKDEEAVRQAERAMQSAAQPETDEGSSPSSEDDSSTVGSSCTSDTSETSEAEDNIKRGDTAPLQNDQLKKGSKSRNCERIKSKHKIQEL